MKTVSFYRVCKELTDNNGKVVHTTPLARCKNLATAKSHGRVWGNGWQCGVYAIYTDGTKDRICTC